MKNAECTATYQNELSWRGRSGGEEGGGGGGEGRGREHPNDAAAGKDTRRSVLSELCDSISTLAEEAELIHYIVD